MKRYVLHDDYKPGSGIDRGKGRATALRLVRELHDTFPGGVVTEGQIFAKFDANIDELKEYNKEDAAGWVRFLLRHHKDDGNWYKEV